MATHDSENQKVYAVVEFRVPMPASVPQILFGHDFPQVQYLLFQVPTITKDIDDNDGMNDADGYDENLLI